jgi:transcriptional regulator with XRE-family HTH domain
MNKLRSVRQQKKWTEAELSRRSKISYSTISRFETGVAVPSQYLKRRLSRILQTKLSILFPAEKEDQQ